MGNTLKITNLSIYSITHAIVDAACILLVLNGVEASNKLSYYIILYNILAFGLQAPFGWLSDKIKKPKLLSIIGCGLIIVGLFSYLHAQLAIVLVGSGNALFHVGGGSIALNLNEKKAAMPGVFVSTGTLGLFFGGLYGKTIGYFFYPFAGALLICSILIAVLKTVPLNYKRHHPNRLSILYVAIVLLLLTIVLRSAIGLSLHFSWKTNFSLALSFTIAVAFGKAIGGFISDRLGWLKISVIGLLLSALLIYFGKQHPIFGITGIFLFNFTMPVTLVAISNLLPGRPGFSFGLTTIALIIGAFPTFGNNFPILHQLNINVLLILISTAIIFVGLKIYFFLTGGSTKVKE